MKPWIVGRVFRNERFTLMSRLAELPKDMVFFTQITMEAAEDIEFLDAMKRARIKGALVGVEAVTAEGLKSVFKDFNYSGEGLSDNCAPSGNMMFMCSGLSFLALPAIRLRRSTPPLRSRTRRT